MPGKNVPVSMKKKMEWNLLQALLAVMLLSPPHAPPAAPLEKGHVGAQGEKEEGTWRWI